MDSVKTILMKARYEAKTNWIKATCTLNEAIEKYPAEPDLYDELATIYLNKQSFDKAASILRHILSLKENDIDTIFKLAYCHLVQKDYQRAITYYDMIAEMVPEAAYNKCVALCQINRNDQAIECLEEITSGPCDSDKPYLLLARLYIELERHHNAVKLLCTAKRRFGDNGELYHLRGVAYFKTKKWLKAYSDFVNAETYGETFPSFYRMFALTSERIGKTERAISLLRHSIETFPQSFAAYYDLINIYTMHEMFRDALEVIELLAKHGLSLSDKVRYEGGFYNKLFDDMRKSKG